MNKIKITVKVKDWKVWSKTTKVEDCGKKYRRLPNHLILKEERRSE